MNILTIGDVYGKSGMDMLSRHIRSLKKLYSVDFTIANGENAAGLGITPTLADDLFNIGVDIITLGNHSFDRGEIADYLDRSPYILRPLNFTSNTPGKGYEVIDMVRQKLCVVSLIGRSGMNYNADNPFATIDRLLSSKELEGAAVIVDFHAEATSEKHAMAYHLDGRAAVVFGTHTHVQTADARIFKNGLGYMTDIGMTGPIESVIGVKPEQALNRFLGDMAVRFETAQGPARLCGAVFEVEGAKCASITPISITD